jgi:hypothetical protein
MAVRLSTGLVNSLMGNAFLLGTSMAYVDGGVGNDYITDVENRFINEGFRVGDSFTTTDSDTGGNDLADEPILALTAGKLEFLSGQVVAAEAFLAATTITSNNRGSLQELLLDGIIHIFSGTQPADADDAEGSTKLMEVTISSGAFVPGAPGNGLEISGPTLGVIGINPGDVWSGVGIVDGTAGWFRFYSNAENIGADPSAVRLDGICGTSQAQLNMSSLLISKDATTTIDSFVITMPRSA